MDDKIEQENQVAPAVTPRLQVGKQATPASFKPGHGGTRAGAGRPGGSANRVTSTFRDILRTALSEVGDSEKVGEDGTGTNIQYSAFGFDLTLRVDRQAGGRRPAR
jgi:hypothetical protein